MSWPPLGHSNTILYALLIVHHTRFSNCARSLNRGDLLPVLTPKGSFTSKRPPSEFQVSRDLTRQLGSICARFILLVGVLSISEVNGMERDYDICERFPDASVRCLVRVHGTLHVPKVLEERGKQTSNECFAIDIRSREIIARVNHKVARRAQLTEHLTQNR